MMTTKVRLHLTKIYYFMGLKMIKQLKYQLNFRSLYSIDLEFNVGTYVGMKI